MTECKYKPVWLQIRKIKKMIKKGIWEGSLCQEEVMYDMQKGFYSPRNTKKLKKLFGIKE